MENSEVTTKQLIIEQVKIAKQIVIDLTKFRIIARRNGQFKSADKIRNILKKYGFDIEDMPNGGSKILFPPNEIWR